MVYSLVGVYKGDIMKKKKIKFKGRLRNYMCWPLYFTIVWVCADATAFTYDKKLGICLTGFTVVYLALVLCLYFKCKNIVAGELINFATKYSIVQKKLLNEFEIPYALLERSGKILWMNEKFSEKMDINKNYHKSITTLFPTVTREFLAKSEDVSDLRIENDGLCSTGYISIR